MITWVVCVLYSQKGARAFFFSCYAVVAYVRVRPIALQSYFELLTRYLALQVIDDFAS